MEEKIIWCLKIKNGIKITQPNEEEGNSFMNKAKKDLVRLKSNKIDEDWQPIVAYYSAYYAIYSILRFIGLKSENHSCTIEVFKEILRIIDEKKIDQFDKTINRLRKNREKAQYYLEIKKSKISDVEEIISIAEEIKDKALLKKEKIKSFISELLKLVNEEI